MYENKQMVLNVTRLW